MIKKAFTAPFWGMLIVGILNCCFDAMWAFSVYHVGSIRIYTLLFFAWSLLCFAESLVYLQIRRRNEQRFFSWLHVILFSLAILSPYVIQIVGILSSRAFLIWFRRVNFYYF